MSFLCFKSSETKQEDDFKSQQHKGNKRYSKDTSIFLKTQILTMYNKSFQLYSNARNFAYFEKKFHLST